MTTFWNEFYRYLFLYELIIPKNWQKCQFFGIVNLHVTFIYLSANDLAEKTD